MNTNTIDRWQILRDRVPQDQFYYAVVSTGVVCRTGCPSRLPRAENVRFYDSLAGAYQDGYRPCRRCLDRDDRQALLARVCAALTGDCRVADAAQANGLSSRQLQRLFRAELGLSPKQYQIEGRIRRFLALVRGGRCITEAAFDAGFPSLSRLHEQLKDRTGRAPAEHHRPGAAEPVFYAAESTPLGTLAVAQTLKGLCFAGFYDDTAQAAAALEAEFPDAELLAVASDQLEPIGSAFRAALSGEYDALQRLPLDVRGTVFQRAVWREAQRIPPGTCLSYADLARRLERPQATRAVANALGGNRIALAIPCHRVVPADGRGAGGYRWGDARKADLLAREGAR